MTGMWNFKFILCCLGIATFVGAAEISFNGENKITGELMAMDQDGMVTLKTPHANEPIRLVSDKISRINFGNSPEKNEMPKQSVTLINGDSFPAEILSLDDKILKIKSPSLGELDIRREMIGSLDIGMLSRKAIYNGPKQISEWTNSVDEVSEWKVENGILINQGSGQIYRDVKLPENYSVRFKLAWEKSPNFLFYFSDPMDYTGKIVNRYFLQFGRAGIGIKRESTGKQRYPQIADIKKLPQEFVDNEMWLEVRVNRKAGKIDLYINDLLQGRYEDKNSIIPTGSGIAFKCYDAAEDNSLKISEIYVSEWDDRGDKHRTEDRGNIKEDAVIGRNGERFGGRMLSITDGKAGKAYRFKSTFQENPIDLPDAEVSTVYFAVAQNTNPKEFKGMNLFLQGSGNVQVSKCELNDSMIRITHPLLGDLQLNRTAVSHLEQTATQPNSPKNK
jgi:hypothetical protein